MSASLRRTLAVRFAATMAVGLAATSAAILWGVTEAVRRPADTGLGIVVVALAGVVVLGTAAALIGAWWLAGSAIRPVNEITAQATHIEGGTLDQRIIAHANIQEYQGLVAVLNRMLERLERAFTAQRRLTADVSHELRTPLTALRGEVEVALRSERAPRDYQRVLHSALEEIERLSRITEDALLITRADARDVTANRALGNLNDLTTEVVERWRSRLEGHGLSVRLALDPRLPQVPLDRHLIGRMIDQLFAHLTRQSPPTGAVEVRTTVQPSHVRLTVADSGLSLAPADLPHVFEPFYRADPARSRDGDGQGLGLAIVAAVARLHGGAAHADSAPSRGTRFDIDLAITL